MEVKVILPSGENVTLAPGDRIDLGTGMIVFFEDEEARLLRRIYDKRAGRLRDALRWARTHAEKD